MLKVKISEKDKQIGFITLLLIICFGTLIYNAKSCSADIVRLGNYPMTYSLEEMSRGVKKEWFKVSQYDTGNLDVECGDTNCAVRGSARGSIANENRAQLTMKIFENGLLKGSTITIQLRNVTSTQAVEWMYYQPKPRLLGHSESDVKGGGKYDVLNGNNWYTEYFLDNANNEAIGRNKMVAEDPSKLWMYRVKKTFAQASSDAVTCGSWYTKVNFVQVYTLQLNNEEGVALGRLSGDAVMQGIVDVQTPEGTYTFSLDEALMGKELPNGLKIHFLTFPKWTTIRKDVAVRWKKDTEGEYQLVDWYESKTNPDYGNPSNRGVGSIQSAYIPDRNNDTTKGYVYYGQDKTELYDSALRWKGTSCRSGMFHAEADDYSLHTVNDEKIMVSVNGKGNRVLTYLGPSSYDDETLKKVSKRNSRLIWLIIGLIALFLALAAIAAMGFWLDACDNNCETEIKGLPDNYLDEILKEKHYLNTTLSGRVALFQNRAKVLNGQMGPTQIALYTPAEVELATVEVSANGYVVGMNPGVTSVENLKIVYCKTVLSGSGSHCKLTFTVIGAAGNLVVSSNDVDVITSIISISSGINEKYINFLPAPGTGDLIEICLGGGDSCSKGNNEFIDPPEGGDDSLDPGQKPTNTWDFWGFCTANGLACFTWFLDIFACSALYILCPFVAYGVVINIKNFRSRRAMSAIAFGYQSGQAMALNGTVSFGSLWLPSMMVLIAPTKKLKCICLLILLIQSCFAEKSKTIEEMGEEYGNSLKSRDIDENNYFDLLDEIYSVCRSRERSHIPRHECETRFLKAARMESLTSIVISAENLKKAMGYRAFVQINYPSPYAYNLMPIWYEHPQPGRWLFRFGNLLQNSQSCNNQQRVTGSIRDPIYPTLGSLYRRRTDFMVFDLNNATLGMNAIGVYNEPLDNHHLAVARGLECFPIFSRYVGDKPLNLFSTIKQGEGDIVEQWADTISASNLLNFPYTRNSLETRYRGKWSTLHWNATDILYGSIVTNNWGTSAYPSGYGREITEAAIAQAHTWTIKAVPGSSTELIACFANGHGCTPFHRLAYDFDELCVPQSHITMKTIGNIESVAMRDQSTIVRVHKENTEDVSVAQVYVQTSSCSFYGYAVIDAYSREEVVWSEEKRHGTQLSYVVGETRSYNMPATGSRACEVLYNMLGHVGIIYTEDGYTHNKYLCYTDLVTFSSSSRMVGQLNKNIKVLPRNSVDKRLSTLDKDSLLKALPKVEPPSNVLIDKNGVAYDIYIGGPIKVKCSFSIPGTNFYMCNNTASEVVVEVPSELVNVRRERRLDTETNVTETWKTKIFYDFDIYVGIKMGSVKCEGDLAETKLGLMCGSECCIAWQGGTDFFSVIDNDMIFSGYPGQVSVYVTEQLASKSYQTEIRTYTIGKIAAGSCNVNTVPDWWYCYNELFPDILWGTNGTALAVVALIMIFLTIKFLIKCTPKKAFSRVKDAYMNVSDKITNVRQGLKERRRHTKSELMQKACNLADQAASYGVDVRKKLNSIIESAEGKPTINDLSSCDKLLREINSGLTVIGKQSKGSKMETIISLQKSIEKVRQSISNLKMTSSKGGKEFIGSISKGFKNL